jgi:hypothetical protein
MPIVQHLNFKKMKTLYLWGACILLSTTLFSCSADELETTKDKTEVQKESIPSQANIGPDDDPITVPPPPKKP